MKRLIIALTTGGLISSTGAFAALPATTDPSLVNIPEYPGQFFIGGSGYYLQPSASQNDSDFIMVVQSTAPVSTEIKNIDPGYDWGWGINGGVIFPNTSNDLNISYFHLDTSDSSPFISGTNLAIVDPMSTLFGGSISTAQAKSEYTVNQVDATLGQYINVGCRLILHPNVGLRWSHLDREIDGTYSIVSSSAPVFTTTVFTKEDSDLQGVGPLLGLDADYYIGYGFGAIAHFDSAALAGDIDSTLNAGTDRTNTTLVLNNSFDSNDHLHIVPVMDAKLGLDYTFLFNDASSSDLTLEAGWRFSEYFNAVHRVFGLGVGNAPVTVVRTSNLALNGPYASLVLRL